MLFNSPAMNGKVLSKKVSFQTELDPLINSKLEEICETGKLRENDLDDRALEALKKFSCDKAIEILCRFEESNLDHVTNKSAFLCCLIKSYRNKLSKGLPFDSNGPDESQIRELLERTGYDLTISTGQRKYGGPPPEWDGTVPSKNCEVFCGKIPGNIFENDLVPLFEKCGTIWGMRLMMEPYTNLNRGFAFVTFTKNEDALEAVRQLDSYEISRGAFLQVNISVPKMRLFVGNIPKTLKKEEIFSEFATLTADLKEVIYYSLPGNKSRNRGFCFLDYETHQAASAARRQLDARRVWNCEIIVDWADDQGEPGDDVMAKVRVLFVKNLTLSVTEQTLEEVFKAFGCLERVKKLKHYAFVHFEDRGSALRAMEALNGKPLFDTELDVSLAKPPSDKKDKEIVLRKRELRTFKSNRRIKGFIMSVRWSNLKDQTFPSMYNGSSQYYSPRSCMRSPKRLYDSPHWRSFCRPAVAVECSLGDQNISNCGDPLEMSY